MEAPKEERYFDRELSWIEFNGRVLAEAMDENNPLLDRLKFIGIVSSNLDEFFMVRMASLMGAESSLREVYAKSFELMDRQRENFTGSLYPQLEKAGITRIIPPALTDKQHEHLRRLLETELMPLLTPVAIREEYGFPTLVNMGLYSIVELKDYSYPGILHYAVIEIPKNYPRMVTLPSEKPHAFILLEDIVSLFARELFTGYEILHQGLFRLTRAAELSIDEEKDEDFAKVMSEALRTRRLNYPVRLEIDAAARIVDFVKKRLELPDYRIYRCSGWFDLKSIAQLAHQPVFEELKLPAWTPKPVMDFETPEDIWPRLKEKDLLVHHPYESFDAFLHFLKEAARDPDVLVIKQTLYRTAHPSAVIRYLAQAAENGKQVTVLVELKARFDEQRNIEWAKHLVDAGATVLYGVAGLKTHAKACLVVRREKEGIRRYVHLSTGNYNEKTARLYTDIGFFTSRDDLTGDVAAFFNVITGFSHPVGFSRIEIAPYGLRGRLLRYILREAMRSKKERPGLIIAKMNSLVDTEIIEAFYKASQAGVQIKLNVRGVCRLKPGIKGLSENVEVVSVVDMFLEHSRIFYFYNDGDDDLFLSSADWMPRNFDRRIEIMFPVEDPACKARLRDLLELYFKDNVKSWRLLSDGSYERKQPDGGKKFRIQEFLCRKAVEETKTDKPSAWRDLKPQRPK